MNHHHHTHDPVLVILSIAIAIFASYTALDLANSITSARGRARTAWLLGGSIAMGVGIWSMHFVGMLAFSLEGIPIAYDVYLLLLSIVVAIVASALALLIISRDRVGISAYVGGSLLMGAAISGMHYIGIASMRMAATWTWNFQIVALSIVIAIVASFGALQIAIRLKSNLTTLGFIYRGAGGVVMGIAVAGMHYTGMAAMTFTPTEPILLESEQLLATSGLAVAVIGTTLLILGIALAGSVVDRALGRHQAVIRGRDEFLSVASHELKTPLTTLKLQAQTRRRDLARKNFDAFTVEKLERMFDNDVKHLDRIARLIDDMLDISRITSGRLTLTLEHFDLCELVKEIVDRHRPQFEAAGCLVELEVCAPVMGHWDRFRLEQVLTNLLTNSMKYGARRPVRVSVLKGGNHRVKLMVQDQGIGVAKEDQGRIFRRFERAVPANEISGLGLGLYIVKQIVEDHGGTIRVKSTPGKGSTFTVELPLEDVQSEARA